ncbi:MAG: PAS domain S-box protein [Saprospirales bacterium]|nr:MAG: PAS domain S-box protein [Saprospirales bacterium]
MLKTTITNRDLLELSICYQEKKSVESAAKAIFDGFKTHFKASRIVLFSLNSDESLVLRAGIQERVYLPLRTAILAEFRDKNLNFERRELDGENWQVYRLAQYGFLALLPDVFIPDELEEKIATIANHAGIHLNLLAKNKRYQIFNALIRSSTDGIQVAEEDGTMYYVNESAAERIGLENSNDKPLNEIKVRDFEGIFSEEGSWEKHIDELKKKESLIVEGINVNRKTGDTFPVEVTAKMVHVTGRNYVVAISRDITQRKESEKKLKRLTEQFQLAIEGSNDGIWDWDLRTNRTFFSSRWKEMVGYGDEELENSFETFAELLHPDDHKRVLDHLDLYLKGEFDHFKIDFRMKHKEGHYKWIAARGAAFRDSDGIPYRMAGSHTDISHRKEMEEDLVKVKDLLEQAGKMAKVGAWEVDMNTKMGFTFSVASDILEVPDEFTATLKDSFALFVEEDAPVIEKAFKKAVETGETYELELRKKQAKGGYKWVRTMGKPEFKNGKCTRVLGVIQDIDEEKRRSIELEETKNMLESIFNEMTDVVWSMDLTDNKLLFLTPSIEKISGFPHAELMRTKNWWEKLIHPEESWVIDEVWSRLEKAGAYNITHKILTAEGKVKWVLNKGKFVHDNTGRPVRYDALVSDRTDQKRIQEQLKNEINLQRILIDVLSTYINISLEDVEENIERSLEQLGEFVQADRVYIFQYDFPNGTTSNTFEWCRSGVSPEIQNLQNIPLNSLEEWVEKHRKGEYYLIEDVSNYNGKNAKSLKELLEPQGIKSMLAVPMMSEGEPIGFVGFDSVRDIRKYTQTEKKLLYLFSQMLVNIENRKKWESQLRLQEEKYRNLIDDMNIGLINLDENQNISFVNDTFCKMSGYKESEVVGINIQELELFGESYQVVRSKEDLRKEGIADTYELPVRTKKGKKKWWLISGSPSYNDRNEIIGTIGAMLDITRQKNLEKELTESKVKAEKAAQAREVFLANMSHEIRTPLSVVIGMIRQLSQEKLNKKQSFYVEQSASAARHLLAILNNILDMTKIEAGELSFVPVDFNLTSLLKSLRNIFHAPALEKGVEFKLTIDPHLADALFADDTRIRQILFNLLNNSLKFTEKGYIHLRVEVKEISHSAQKLSIVVEDTGIGMSGEFVKKIFDKFSQEDYSFNRRFDGTGLGMAISKDLANKMGGKLIVESEKGKGTKFSLELKLPLGNPDRVMREKYELKPEELKDCSILIVEDNQMNRLIVRQSLIDYGCKILEAKNGLIAIELLKKWSPDLILMDIQMPEMDGVQTTRHIRSKLKLDVPIIALTANAFKHDIDKYLKAGMNDYIIKPYDENDLYRKVNFYLKNKELNIKSIAVETGDSLYDLTSLKEMSNGDENFVKQLVGVFIRVAQETMADIEASLKNNDIRKINKLAHKLKSSIDQLRIDSIKRDIRELEKFPATGRSKQELVNLTTKISTTIETVIEDFRQKYNLKD